MVSVLMPTYNRAEFLLSSINSVLSQTYTDLELIIVDDGSTDHTRELIDSYSDSRIKFHAIEHSGLVSRVRNVTLEHAMGKYIAFLDSDDLWESDHLASLVTEIETDDQIGIAFSNVIEFKESQILRDGIYPNSLTRTFQGPIDLLPMILQIKFSIYPTSVLLRKDGVKAAGRFNESISITETNFLGRIAKNYKAVYTHRATAKVRKHTSNHSDELRSTAVEELLMLIDELKKSEYLSGKEHKQLSFKYYYQFGIQCMSRSDLKLARKAFSKSLVIKPWSVKPLIRWIITWTR